jgi:hypothetical protein
VRRCGTAGAGDRECGSVRVRVRVLGVGGHGLYTTRVYWVGPCLMGLIGL